MPILPFWLLLLMHFGTPKTENSNFIQIATYAIIGVEIVIVGCLTWLLRNPASFEIRLTENEFSISHPISKWWSFTVKPSDVMSIENVMDIHSVYDRIFINMINGERHALCCNYFYSRKKLYAALAKVNPSIIFPKNPYLFTSRSNKKIQPTRKARG